MNVDLTHCFYMRFHFVSLNFVGDSNGEQDYRGDGEEGGGGRGGQALKQVELRQERKKMGRAGKITVTQLK